MKEAEREKLGFISWLSNICVQLTNDLYFYKDLISGNIRKENITFSVFFLSLRLLRCNEHV